MISIKQMHQKCVKFVITGTLKIFVLNMNHIFAMVVMVYWKKAMNFNDVALASVKGSDYRINFWYMS